MRPAAPAAVLALVLLAPAALAASGTYVAVGGDATAICTPDEGSGPPFAVGPDLGGACDFPVPDGAVEVEVELRDRVTDPTGGYYRLDDAGGDAVAAGGFCGNVTADVPGEAVELDVFVDNAFGPLHCWGQLGTATAGEVVVTWS